MSMERFIVASLAQNRLKVSLSEVSPLFITAVLAREDTRFYRTRRNRLARNSARLGSRYSRAAQPRKAPAALPSSSHATAFRSVAAPSAENCWKQWCALRIERQFTKQQILELYINRIYFGTGCYGVETASASLFRQKRIQAESSRGRAPRWIDSKSKSFFAAEESGKARRCNATPFWIAWLH